MKTPTDTELLDWMVESGATISKIHKRMLDSKSDTPAWWVDYESEGSRYSTPYKHTPIEALRAAYNGETDED